MSLFRYEKLPDAILTGTIQVNQATFASATAGSATLPSNPVAFLEVTVAAVGSEHGAGTIYKIPLYNV
jgi:hypothetical protein